MSTQDSNTAFSFSKILKGSNSTYIAAFLAYFFYTLWMHFNFYSLNALVISEAFSSSFSYISSVAVSGITLLLMALFYRKSEQILFSSGMIVASIFLCSLGTLLALSSAFMSPHMIAIDIVGGALTGIGSVPILLMLAVLLVQRNSLAPVVFFAFLSANVAAAFLGNINPTTLLIFVLLMPPLIVLFLFLARRKASEPSRSVIEKSDLKSMLPLIGRMFVLIFLVYSINVLIKRFFQLNYTSVDPLALILTSLLVGGVVAISSYSSEKKFNVVSLYRTVFLFALVCFFSVPLFGENYGVSYSIMSVFTVTFRALIFICEYRICVKTGLSPILVFGVGETFKKIPTIIMFLISPYLPLEEVFGNVADHIPLFIIPGILLVIVYVLVFTEKDLSLLVDFDRTLSASEALERQRIEIAQKFRLTERENEVFLLLCDGRSAPRIAKELYVSQATVNVHVKNIYRKLDIHSRQELLDLAKT